MQTQVKRDTEAVLTRLPKGFAWLLFLFYAAVLLRHAQPPSLGDLSNWTYSGALFARHLAGTPDPWHTLKRYPVPNSLLTVVVSLLCVVLPFATAVKAFLILYLLLCLAAVQRLARVTQASPLVWCIAPAGFFLAVNFWYGFLAFQIGIALLFFFTAELVWSLRNKQPARPWHLFGLLLLLFFTHAVPFVFACMLLMFFALQTSQLRLLRVLSVPMLLMVLYGAGRMYDGNVDATALPALPPHSTLYLLAYKVNTYLKSFGLVNPTVGTAHSLALTVLGRPAFVIVVAISLVVSAAMLWVYCGATAAKHLLRYSFFSLAACISLIGYVCMPQMLLGISDPGSRILQTVLWLALFLCVGRADRSDSIRVAAAGSVVLAAAGAALFVTVPWSRVPVARQQLPAAIEGLAKAPSGYAAAYTRDALHGKWNDEVFPTGVFRNRDVDPVKPFLPDATTPAP